jgi:hypothetical protein
VKLVPFRLCHNVKNTVIARRLRFFTCADEAILPIVLVAIGKIASSPDMKNQGSSQ